MEMDYTYNNYNQPNEFNVEYNQYMRQNNFSYPTNPNYNQNNYQPLMNYNNQCIPQLQNNNNNNFEHKNVIIQNNQQDNVLTINFDEHSLNSRQIENLSQFVNAISPYKSSSQQQQRFSSQSIDNNNYCYQTNLITNRCEVNLVNNKTRRDFYNLNPFGFLN